MMKKFKKIPKDAVQKTLPLLPPCRVCGEKASGLHYGVNTCEACKAFFRRSLQRGNKYKCSENNNCSILPGKRSSCSACRFNKCVNLGMCKEAIKTGRYTHEKRSEDIREVKRLSNLQQNVTTTTASPISVTSSGSPPKDGDTNPTSSSNSTEELEAIIHNIVHNYSKDSIFNDKFFEQLPQRQKDYLEKKALQNEVFGPLKPISKDEYQRIYQTTGIDVDGRKEELLEEIPHLERAIKKFISFAKTIPGFNTLSIDDQISLIKAAKFEAWMVCCHKLFDVEKGLFATQGGRVVGMDDMKKVNNEEFVDDMFRLEGMFQKLQMSLEETCILAAVCVMYTDICTLQNPEKVQESQNLLLRCLLHLLKKYHPEEPLRIAHICSCLLQLRTVKKQHSIEEENFLMEWSNRVEFPRLIFEIWSS